MKRRALAVLLLLGVGTEAMAQPPPPALRYLSYNLLHGGVFSGLTGEDEDLEARFRIAVAGLRALDADLVALQEASWSRGRGNVAERLARELGFHHVYAPALFRITPVGWFNRSLSWIMNFSEGPAVLSRFPIVAWQAHDLPRCNGFIDPRVLLHVTVRTPWGDLGVASTHTSRGFCEAEPVVALMQAHRGLLPSVLMGDFNSDEESPATRTLTGRAGFVDAFRAANPSAPGLTVWQPVHAPAPTVRRRVDYVFMLPGRAVPGRVRGSRVVLDAPGHLGDGKVLWPSDHYGVLAELEVFPSQTATPAAEEPPPEPAGAPE
ncbi:MAG: endonuclease/exonuclease/phosphatase family protein [Candidatus Rokubacteria bacterium]|nr:endonuclease/exonuclease/phosphatase family protein [Candidatus Rokubacteria bacterium]